MYDVLFQNVQKLIPMKESAAKALKRLQIITVRDLIFYKPTSYNIIDHSSDFTKIKYGMLIQASVTIDDMVINSSRRLPTKIYTSNNTGTLTLVFFNKIPPFIFSRLKVGGRYIVSGKISFFDNAWQITHPDFIFKKSISTEVEPVYPLTYGLINKQLYGYIRDGINLLERAIGVCKAAISDHNNIFHSEKKYMQELLREVKALHLINIKPNHDLIQKSIAGTIENLSAKELFANQVSLSRFRKKAKLSRGHSFSVSENIQQEVLDQLSFVLTEGQRMALSEIESDQASDHQMMRLLQGDVGSGKTLVALLAMINVAKNGHQSTIMVPTDLLSIQHFQFFQKALSRTNIKVSLLTGKTTAKERRIIKEGLLSGDIDILIGTHALFQESVEFAKLGFVVIDEQHRFGVEQRSDLIAKSSHPDVLVMTATPIPRSLTLTMFGDMSVSYIKTKPKSRKPIVTSVISNSKKGQLIESLEKKLSLGEKIYWVCPLIDQSDKILKQEDSSDGVNNVKYADVTERYEELNAFYPNDVGILHGKMKQIAKDSIMQKFKDGENKILVATTVVEVGIDVPDATLIIIENAEKFGLSQLHQLRGRVGRGELQSHCMLVYEPKRISASAKKRLDVMRISNDGFYISEQDLLLRGGGEILGTKQSGEPEFFFADLGRDINILLKANKFATAADDSSFINFQTDLFSKSN